MKNLTLWLLLIGAAATGSAQSIANSAQPVPPATRLQTEHLTNPLGIDAPHPRLSWTLTVPATQSTITIGTDSTAVAAGKGDKQTSTQQLTTYQGPPLQPFTKYYWSITSTTANGQQIQSAVAKFETGMLDQSNWKGSWITDTRDIHTKPAAYFRHNFAVNKTITSARLYIAAAGLYELSINGQHIGDRVLDPMYTRFDRRNLYATYDLTAAIKNGDNTIGVLLGNGWYNLQSTAVWYFDKAPWRARPSFCLDLRLTYSDGSTETISSGKDWKTALSPIIFNSIYTGEHVDNRLAIPHWNEPSFIDTAWKQPIFTGTPSQNVTAETTVPIRIKDTLKAASMRRFNDTDYVFDLGRNIAGVSAITLHGQPGTIIRLKHGERLYADGHVDQSNISVHYRPTDDTDPFQTDIYTLKGDPGGAKDQAAAETFMPRFNYKGFQYVEVTANQPITLTKESLTGYFMHSDVNSTGRIQTSNPTINKIWQAANASYLSNLFGYPTDCPQREKNGWTGDAQINVETGLYNFDAITVYEKWLADLRDEQQPNGILPSIVPTGGWGYEWGNGPDWTSAIAIIPWNLYLFYGDSKPLADCYDNIKRYVDHIDQLYPTGLTTWGLGDWIPVKSKTPVEFTSTAYYYADVSILANAAKLLDRQADYSTYTTLGDKIKLAFNKKYLDPYTGNYDKGLQTELSAALYWHLVPEEQIKRTARALANRVRADSVKLDVGLLGTKTILNALSENGYADLAYQLASSEKQPSWGWWIVNGATTLYENWPINSGSDISLNHIMFGEISAWFYKGLGGILPDTAAPGFRHIRLHPHFVHGLNEFSATHDCPYGPITSSWTRTSKILTYTITLPPGTTATLTLDGPDAATRANSPDRQDDVNGGPAKTQVLELTAGTWTFTRKDDHGEFTANR
jgi:alpha-L-rhamnosidase